MWDIFIWLLRFAAFVLSLPLLYTIFLKEDQDKKLDALDAKVRNVLSEWWIKIDDAKKHNLSRHTMFMRVVAGGVTTGLDTLFGRKLLSLQAISVSACYKTASLTLFSLLTLSFSKYIYRFSHVPDSFNSETIPIVVVGVLLFLALGSFPLFTRKRKWMRLWYGVLIIMVLLLVASMFSLAVDFAKDTISSPKTLGLDAAIITAIMFVIFVLGVGVGVACYAGFIVVTRKLLRWSSGLDSFSKIAAVVLLNLVFPLALVLVPVAIIQLGMLTVGRILVIAIFIALFVPASNVITALASCAFIVLAGVMLAHRLVYSLIGDPVYSLQKAGIIKRKKLAVSIGLALMGFAVGSGVPALLKDIFKDYAG